MTRFCSGLKGMETKRSLESPALAEALTKDDSPFNRLSRDRSSTAREATAKEKTNCAVVAAESPLELCSKGDVRALLEVVTQRRLKGAAPAEVRPPAEREVLPGGDASPFTRRQHTIEGCGGVRGSRRQQCSCGTCPQCRENARWEQIFGEKFADPDYYKPGYPRHGSSLSWL
jgi:hypothetical protein